MFLLINLFLFQKTKDLGLDSIIIIDDATLWASKYKCVIKDTSAFLNGTDGIFF